GVQQHEEQFVQRLGLRHSPQYFSVHPQAAGHGAPPPKPMETTVRTRILQWIYPSRSLGSFRDPSEGARTAALVMLADAVDNPDLVHGEAPSPAPLQEHRGIPRDALPPSGARA